MTCSSLDIIVQTVLLDPSSVAVPRFSAILGLGKEEALQDLLAKFGASARIVRVGNPLRSPLTIERMLIQAGEVEVGMLPDDAAAERALRRLSHLRDGESQVVLVIDQAETLSAAALRTLSRLGQADSQVALSTVFKGDPSFLDRLPLQEENPIRAALHLDARPPGRAASAADPSASGMAPVPSGMASPALALLPPPEDPARAAPMPAPMTTQVPAPSRIRAATSAMLRDWVLAAALCGLGAAAVLALPYVLRFAS